MSDCAITILHAPGRRLAKLIRADGRIIGYDNAKHFDAREQPLADLDDLRKLLEWLRGCPEQCIVRGSLIDPERSRNIRRLLHPDPKTGDQPTLYEVPRRWVSVDVDGIPLPPEIDATDIERCAQAAIRHLPHEFHGKGYLAFPTASHSIKPGIRMRLWFWLDGAATRKVLQAWFFDTPGVDLCLFRPAQINYTAHAVFAPGAVDPNLCWIVQPGALVPVRPLPPPAPSPVAPAPPSREAGTPPKDGSGANGENRPVPSSGRRADRYRDAALAGIKAQLLRATENHRHHALVAAATRLFELDCLSDGYVTQFIRDAARVLNGRGTRQIDPEEVDELLDWARVRTTQAAPTNGGRNA